MNTLFEYIELIKSRPVVAITIGLLLLLTIGYTFYTELTIKYENSLTIIQNQNKEQITNLQIELQKCNKKDSLNRLSIENTLNNIINQQKEELNTMRKLENLTHKTIKKNEDILDNN